MSCRHHVPGNPIGTVVGHLPPSSAARAFGYDDLPSWAGVPSDSVSGDLLDDRGSTSSQRDAKLAVVMSVKRIAGDDWQRIQIAASHFEASCCSVYNRDNLPAVAEVVGRGLIYEVKLRRKPLDIISFRW